MKEKRIFFTLLLIFAVSIWKCGPFEHDITYEVIGGPGGATVYFTSDECENQNSITAEEIPWRHVLNITNSTSEAVNAELILCAESLNDEETDLTLNIYIDGALRSEMTVKSRHPSGCIYAEVFLDGGYL